MATSLRVRRLSLSLFWTDMDDAVATACNLTGAVVVYLFLYESSDISLENVDLVRVRLGCSSRSLTCFDRCTRIQSANRGRLVDGHRLGTCPARI